MRGDPLTDYIDRRLDDGEPRFIIEVEELLGITDYAAEGTDRSLLATAASCDVTVDYIEASDFDTERATAGDTPLLRIHVSDDITQRCKPAKE